MSSATGGPYVRGSSQRALEPLLRRIGEIDLFVQDSCGTRSVVRQELRLGWQALRECGWVVVGGVNRSEGLRDFLAGQLALLQK